MSLRVLDLFSGIGGFSLGLERTGGFTTVAFCEIEPFCRRVLNKHWPEVPIYPDVRELTARRQEPRALGIDVICGGFPCQDISLAGKGAGIADGTRSGLWSEIARLSSELRPRFVIVENVAALLGRGLDRVLGDLAALGFDAEWHCIPASAVGAPHRRDRVWIIANNQADALCSDANSLGPHSAPLHFVGGAELRNQQVRELGPLGEDVADADNQRQLQSEGRVGNVRGWSGYGGWWLSEPDVGRVAHGVPARVDRLRALGNAVVPQIPELIGRAILAAEQGRAAA